MGNFLSVITSFGGKIKDTTTLVGTDIYTYIIPAMLSILFGLKDMIDIRIYEVLLNMISAIAYTWLSYRLCQLITKKNNQEINKKDAIIHSVIKGVIVVLCTMILYFIATFIPFINLLEHVDVIGPGILYFLIISFVYLTVTFLYPIKC